MDEIAIFLALAAFCAGMIDAVVGGGGLIQVPALFAGMPQTVPATLLGSNKLASVWGTTAAAYGYARKIRVHGSTALPAACAGFVLSFFGAMTVTHVPPDLIRRLLPVIVVVVAVYTFMKKDFGQIHAPAHTGYREKWMAVLVGGGIGFYDGLFGPGTGSFLIFLFIRFFGFDFLAASAVSKVVNVACNVAALLWFGYSGHLIWQLGLLMGVCNVAGSLVGIRLAIRYGTGFVRILFLLVVSALILKTSYDAFLV